jgi:hypothetical protein
MLIWAALIQSSRDSTVTLRYASRHAKVSDVEKRVLPKGYTMVPMGMFRSGDAHSKLGTEGLNGCIGVAVLGMLSLFLFYLKTTIVEVSNGT